MAGTLYPLNTHASMVQLHDRRYTEVREARESGKKVVWCSGIAVSDIPVSMGFLPFFPENHATICGAQRVGTELCEIAEDLNYPQHVCSYARNNIGALMGGEHISPTGALPPPDLLLSASLCNSHIKWFQELSRLYNVPFLMLDTPLLHDGMSKDDEERATKYAVQQLYEMTDFLADYCGKPFDFDRLSEAVSYTGKAARLYGEIVKMAKHRPSPITAFDMFIHMEPLLDWRGFPESVEYFEKLLAEVTERKNQNFSAVGEEKYRLYWDGLPIWFRFGHLARMLASYGAACCIAAFPFNWVESLSPLDPEHPLESIAHGQMTHFLNRGTGYRIDMLANIIQDYALDGLVMQASRTCRLYVAEQIVLMREVQRRTGVPGAIVEGDMVDSRLYSDSEAESRIQTLMNMIEERARVKA